MIKKILTREYLKGYGDMTDDERKAFDGRVGEWLSKHGTRLVTMTNRPMAKSQNLMTLTTRWTVEDCRAVEDGILLMSALMKVADTWLPSQIYMRSAFRAVRQMVGVLIDSAKWKVNGLNLLVDPVTGAPTTKTGNTVTGQPKNPLPTIKTVGREYDAATDTVKAQREVVPAHQPSAVSHQPSSGLVPARPRHIDQYVHLLPKTTQERAEKYGPLMRELDEMREKQRLLLDADGVGDRDREAVAKRIVAIDKEIGGIRRELDAEWEKLVKSGRVVVDDLGMARVIESEHGKVDSEKSAAAQFSDTEHQSSSINSQTSLTSEQKARRRELRKFLTDTRRGNGKTREEHVDKWQEAWKEYLTLEPQEAAMKDEKILAAMEHYGINDNTKTKDK